ncbi:MAG: hypothetical protein AB7H81_14045 [Vicinamibacterales bacterium]
MPHGRLTQWIPRLILGLLAGGIYAIVSVAHTLDDAPPGALEIDLTASANGTLQVFYDRGAGISEAESVTAPIAATPAPHTYRLPLPFGRYRLLRVDPNTGPGRYGFEGLRLVDGRGETVATLTADAIQSTVQATVAPTTGGGFTVTTPPDATDPQVVLAPGAPLLLLPARANLAALAAASLAIALAVIVLAAFADRLTVLAAATSRAAAWAGQRPWQAVVCAGMLGAVAATYPLFLGRSLVSPANGPAWLLYDQPPFAYGARDIEVENARGTDVGAMMWAILPYSATQRDALAAGEFPLWNRYNLAGLPLWGQGQTFILDPFHLLSLAVPDPSLAMDARFVVARAVFAVGSAIAVLAVTGSLAAGAFVGLMAPFVAHFTMRFNHPAYFSLVYAPWILAAYAGLALSPNPARRWRWAAALAVATGLQIVGTTPKEGIMALAGAHVAGLAGLLLAREPFARRLGRVDAALLGTIAGLLLSAPHWLVFLVTLGQTATLYDRPAVQFADRVDLVSYVLGGAAPGTPQTGAHPLVVMAGLSALLFPGRLASSRVGVGALAGTVVLAGLAFGLVPASWLEPLPLVGNIHHVDNTFLAATIAPLLVVGGVGLASLTAAVRDGAVVRPSIAVAGATLALAALIPGVGVDLASLLALLTVVGAAATLCVILTSSGPAPSTAAAAVVSLFAAVFAGGLQLETGVAAADALLIQPKHRAELAEPSPALQVMQARAREPFRVAPIESVLFPGTQAYWGLEGIGGPDALRLEALEDLSDAAGIERTTWMWRTMLRPHSIDAARGFLDVLNVRFLVARADQVPAGAGTLPLTSPDLVRVIERPSAWPRAFMVDGVERHASVGDLARRLSSSSGPFASVDAADEVAVSAVAHLRAPVPTVTVARDYLLTPNTTTFRIEAAGPGLAVLSEAFMAEDFRATLNGTAVPYLRVNHAFKAVVIPAAGSWTVRFEYRPRLWTWSWLLAGAGLVLLLGIPLVASRLLD